MATTPPTFLSPPALLSSSTFLTTTTLNATLTIPSPASSFLQYAEWTGIAVAGFLVFCVVCKLCGCFADACTGYGDAMYWLCSPCMLYYHACDIYCYQCLNLYLRRAFFFVCCCCCRTLNCCWEFTDPDFPPDDTSLGGVGGDTATGDRFSSGQPVDWVRANDLSEDGLNLFDQGVNSNSILQGSIGNCWLMAAMGALAEKKGSIYALFETKEIDPRGKYRIRIYDGLNDKWDVVTIDDFIPCRKKYNGQYEPLFSKPANGALWVLLLEKAFAKWAGSYAAIEGGHNVWALRAMTGDKARIFRRSGAVWERLNLMNLKDPNDRRALAFVDGGESRSNEDFFEVLEKYYRRGAVLCAAGANGKNGLIQGHGYSILQVRKAAGFRLVQLRNPHGHGGEWIGNWSDTSILWKNHKDVARAVGFEYQSRAEADNGIFWMSWGDFCTHWDQVDIVDRTVDISTVQLKLEDGSNTAPARACFSGCFSYWCLCKGPRRIFTPKHSSEVTIEPDKDYGWCPCCPKQKYKEYTSYAGYSSDSEASSAG